jgi:hypothetical protein
MEIIGFCQRRAADPKNGGPRYTYSQWTALSHREFDIETKDTFPLAPLGEMGLAPR